IDFEDYNNDRTDVIKRAKEKLDAVINSGTNLEGNQTVLNLSKENEGFIYPTFGFHPVTSQECTTEELHEAQKHLIDNINDIDIEHAYYLLIVTFQFLTFDVQPGCITNKCCTD
ncbi:TatD family hydrolase, partial [Klebsiella pneumoniae]|uniref:TatD family hydrolase n=1 Tax=Klebsiella pneumoniae TaxID=573 RepID=UPI003AF54A11